MKKLSLLLLVSLAFPVLARASVNLSLSGSGHNHVSFSYDGDEGIYSITTTGGDPYVYTSSLPRALNEDETHLRFEYKASRTISNFQIYFGNSWAENRSRTYGNLTATGGQWREMDISLEAAMQSFGWGSKGQQLRFDFGFQSGYSIQLRNIQVMASDDPAETYKRTLNKHLATYLDASFTEAEVENVEVKANLIVVRGRAQGSGGYRLVEIPFYQDVTEQTEFVAATDITESPFELTLSRYALRNGLRYDRMLSKWAIVDTTASTPRLVSHARCADDVYQRYKAPQMILKGKKGLGGFYLGSHATDLDELAIKSVTINIVLTSLISTSPSSFASHLTYSYAARSYYIDQAQVSNLDATLRYCTSRGIVTAAILLVSPDACPAVMKPLMIHPQCDGGYYSMPNLTTPESVCAYAAIINFLAERYSRNTNGRINHWIMHNEVDYGREWTNMGTQPVRCYMDAYYKSMRIVSSIARQYDPNAWVLGSFTHSWTASSPNDGPGFNTHNMLRILSQYSAAEGDFRWGVAYHPYPQDLTKPRFWIDDTQSTYDPLAPYCTFKNLEVIDLWARHPDNFYQGLTKRLVFLSENGTNSPDYSETQLRYQAAGACWAWKKAARLQGIDAIQWHNWQDNRQEFGLRIGLRRYADDASQPGAPKPAWYVWQAADTESEDALFDTYLPTLGVASWDQIFNERMLPLPSVVAPTPLSDGIYTLAGQRISDASATGALPPGIYVVSRGGKARKVLLR